MSGGQHRNKLRSAQAETEADRQADKEMDGWMEDC